VTQGILSLIYGVGEWWEVGVGGSFKVEVRFKVIEGVDEFRRGCGLELVQKWDGEKGW